MYNAKTNEDLGVYELGINGFVDDMIVSYDYIVNNNADVDGAMQELASSTELELKIKKGKGPDVTSYCNGLVIVDFHMSLQLYDKNTGKYKGSQSPALGFWSEVYHAYIDLIDEQVKNSLQNDDIEEEYVHANKEHKVIDALKKANSESNETKRKSYGEAEFAKKVDSPTKTLEDK